MRTLLEIVEEGLTPKLTDEFTFGAITTLGALIGTTVGALLGFLLLLLESARASRGMPFIRFRGSNAAVKPPALSGNLKYHYFISHVWSSGQDQARALKTSMANLVNDLNVFLGAHTAAPFITIRSVRTSARRSIGLIRGKRTLRSTRMAPTHLCAHPVARQMSTT